MDLAARFSGLEVAHKALEVRRARAEARRRLFGAREAPISLGRFTLCGQLGAGAMGVVYAAHDPVLDRRIALKVLHAAVTEGPRAQERLRREAKAMARVSHPNIVPILDVGTEGARTFIAMELVQGETLAKWLEARRPWRVVVDAFVQAGRGLAAAHEEGLVHRDFKPHNAMVGRDGRVRVLDFGLVAGAQTQLAPLTRTGAILGTPGYMAPEVWAGVEADAAADQFSFFAALYGALFNDETSPQGKRKVPIRLRRVMARGLHPDPQHRFDRMDDAVAALERAGRDRRGSVAAFVVGVSVVAAVAVWPRGPDDPCDNADSTLDAAWGEPARAEVGQRFEGLVPRIDAYAAAWAEAFGRQCVAASDLPLRCLAQRKRELVALQATLRGPNPPAAAHAARAVSELPALGVCEDADALARWLPPPPPPAQAAAVDAAQRAVAEATTLEHAGRFEEGLERAHEAAALAEATGYVPALVDARLRELSLLEQLGRYDEAVAVGTEAAAHATQARYDHALATAASRLAYVLGGRLKRLDEAERWSRTGEAAVARLGGTGEAAVLLQQELGALRFEEGKYEEAERHFLRALELARASTGDVAAILSNIGVVRRELGDAEGALTFLEQALALWEEALGPDHPDVASGASNLGALLLDAGRYDAALEQLSRAIAIREEKLGGDHPLLAAALNNVGLVYQLKGDLDQAQSVHTRAIAILVRANGPNDPNLASAEAALGNLALRKKDYPGTREHHQRAIDVLTPAYGQDHPAVARSWARIAEAHLREGAYPEALLVGGRALAVWERSLGPTHREVVTIRAMLGEAHLERGDVQRAVTVLERAVADGEAGKVGDRVLATPRFALARAIWSVPKQRTRARRLAERARAGEATDPTPEAVEAWLRAHFRH